MRSSRTPGREQEGGLDDLKDLDNAVDVDTQRKEGYRKIRFCAQQAKRDGLVYFWVDTCCINKANNTELSKAINSMFRWYQNAKRCYVFLSDVANDTSKSGSKSAFKQSRWFKRGWTLQELLAPYSVEFFSKEGERLGDKGSLQHPIHEVTGIPIEALSGSDLSEFDVAKRFSWAANRQTTEEEDRAYCLFGIFGVHLPLIYGEGKENALERLRSAAILKHKGRSQDQEEKLNKIRSWLSAPNPSTNYHKAHKQRQAKTGVWLLEGEQFTRWKESAASRLWLYGIPGCGKTILSSTIIEHLLQHCYDDTSMVTAYFYFDFNDTQKQDPKLMLRSLLYQLLQSSVVIPNRKERDIERSLESYVGEEDTICLQRDVVDKDIQRYVQQRLRDDKGLAKWNKDAAIRQEIEAALMSGARGMFRWAVCQLDTLGKCCNRAMLRKSLASLPRTLDQTYDRILSTISEEYSKYAMRILQWLTFSARPLSVEEIAEVVAIDVARDPAFDRDEVLEDPLEVLDICSSLVTITKNEADGRLRPAQQIIALAHYSVQEYLVSDRIRQGEEPAYLNWIRLHDPDRTWEGPNLERSLDRVPMPLYYATMLGFSTITRLLLDKGADVNAQGGRFGNALQAASYGGYEQVVKALLDNGADVNAQGGDYNNALQAASVRGHEQVVKTLLDKGADVNAQGGRFGNALQAASYGGYEQVVKTLLDNGADVNAQGGDYNNALQAASVRGHEQVVKRLLDAGADVNAQGEEYSNALYAASARGHEQVVKRLLDAGADVNAQGEVYDNALQAASRGGYEQVVKMLLDKGAEVNAQGGRYGNALYIASARGHEQVVKMLLDKGADVNAQGGEDGNALQAASWEGHEQVVKTLIDKGADVNAQGEEYSNALYAASVEGHEQVVKRLLDAGADVNAQGGGYGNALQAASEGGHEQVVKMLLEAGAHQHQENDLASMPE
ncbi:vegetative incompatibility protein HET-E-1 [Pyrenophora tritici-repentis Pt-1C-BFP]|uniref:Vegetative incompatibility protein HET-E-1 n=1 Tax=Pyrenophora tritici-repentis (strain Pt-1C-BFP) TaxID=426418 RepID=B2WCP5_PYRTR|nr:vegetative incompatibility protein HET-E-1 [Pyrenophora tritici-repentis Pt-1C-BFP]EDU50673.1 vegetative incompatibility protein HET-E-1 [Pyrenophora tritici-repentis Pt-1C-BFP]